MTNGASGHPGTPTAAQAVRALSGPLMGASWPPMGISWPPMPRVSELAFGGPPFMDPRWRCRTTTLGGHLVEKRSPDAKASSEPQAPVLKHCGDIQSSRLKAASAPCCLTYMVLRADCPGLGPCPSPLLPPKPAAPAHRHRLRDTWQRY